MLTCHSPKVTSPADWVIVQVTVLPDSSCFRVMTPVLPVFVSVFSFTETLCVDLSKDIQSADIEKL